MAQASDVLLPGTTATRATRAGRFTDGMVAAVPVIPAAPGAPRRGCGGFPTATPAHDSTESPTRAAATANRGWRRLARCAPPRKLLPMEPVLIRRRSHVFVLVM